MEDTKNIKDAKKENESPELKEELIDEELSELSGGDNLKHRNEDGFPCKRQYNGPNLGN
ncbi:hypothetical protein [Synechococcus sp. UW179A]|uniref:hypothetical protein n=1 Tax=Synechococcus sp. UW179A TaxID=2575510 RepID=UPI001481F67A|nr:hypothetical protein [Synechococcus sp. UW179A]